jgi:hypothetical protein
MADASHLNEWSPYHYAHNNPINTIDPDGENPIKLLKVIAKTAVKSVAKGKVDLGEVYDVVDAVKTVFDPNASIVDKGLAIFDLASPISTKDLKAMDEQMIYAMSNECRNNMQMSETRSGWAPSFSYITRRSSPPFLRLSPRSSPLFDYFWE